MFDDCVFKHISMYTIRIQFLSFIYNPLKMYIFIMQTIHFTNAMSCLPFSVTSQFWKHIHDTHRQCNFQCTHRILTSLKTARQMCAKTHNCGQNSRHGATCTVANQSRHSTFNYIVLRVPFLTVFNIPVSGIWKRSQRNYLGPYLKLKLKQCPAIYTNYMLHHSITLQ